MFSKPPTTFEEQLSILERRNLIVEDEEFALCVLDDIDLGIIGFPKIGLRS